jgi:aryl-alcohol dehydrogenase-like predicted oxidoreductase
MDQRPLGATGLKVSAIGQGCALLSEGYGTPDDEESARALLAGLEAGINFLDTSDAYGIGHNERLLGSFLRGRRNKVILATKVGLVRKPGEPAASIDNSPHYIRSACDASLQRLGIDTIDLYYLQRRNPQVPIEDAVGAMADLVKAGKVRHLGLSEVSPETLQRATRIHPIAAIQSEYSLMSREPESAMLDACRTAGATFVAYCPLGRSFLAGEIVGVDELEPNDFRRRMPRFQAAALQQNLELMPALALFAAEREVSCAQIALAWLLGKHSHVVPIPGSKRASHVIQNAAAAGIKLSADDIGTLDAFFQPSAITGPRLPAPAMIGIE